jgi:hypothetical protein
LEKITVNKNSLLFVDSLSSIFSLTVYWITEKATLKATQYAIPVRFFEVRGFARESEVSLERLTITQQFGI